MSNSRNITRSKTVSEEDTSAIQPKPGSKIKPFMTEEVENSEDLKSKSAKSIYSAYLANSTQQKQPALTPEEKELIDSLKKSSKKPTTVTDPAPPGQKAISRAFKTPSSVVDSAKSSKIGKDSTNRENEKDLHSGIFDGRQVRFLRPATKSAKREIFEEKEKEQEIIGASVPDEESDSDYEEKGKVSSKSGKKGTEKKREREGRNKGRTGKESEANGTSKKKQQKGKSSGKDKSPEKMRIPNVLDALLEDSDYEIKIHVREVGGESESNEDRSEKRSSSRNARKGSHRKSSVRGKERQGEENRNVTRRSSRKRKEEVRENEKVSEKGEEEDGEEADEIVRVVVPDGVGEEEEDEKEARGKKGAEIEKEEEDRTLEELLEKIERDTGLMEETMFVRGGKNPDRMEEENRNVSRESKRRSGENKGDSRRESQGVDRRSWEKTAMEEERVLLGTGGDDERMIPEQGPVNEENEDKEIYSREESEERGEERRGSEEENGKVDAIEDLRSPGRTESSPEGDIESNKEGERMDGNRNIEGINVENGDVGKEDDEEEKQTYKVESIYSVNSEKMGESDVERISVEDGKRESQNRSQESEGGLGRSRNYKPTQVVISEHEGEEREDEYSEDKKDKDVKEEEEDNETGEQGEAEEKALEEPREDEEGGKPTEEEIKVEEKERMEEREDQEILAPRNEREEREEDEREEAEGDVTGESKDGDKRVEPERSQGNQQAEEGKGNKGIKENPFEDEEDYEAVYDVIEKELKERLNIVEQGYKGNEEGKLMAQRQNTDSSGRQGLRAQMKSFLDEILSDGEEEGIEEDLGDVVEGVEREISKQQEQEKKQQEEQQKGRKVSNGDRERLEQERGRQRKDSEEKIFQEWEESQERNSLEAIREVEQEDEGTGNDIGQRSRAVETLGRREYSLYEDWRMLEAMDSYTKRNGEEGLVSKNTWATIKDPLTQRRLLDNKRSGESMRNRARRTLYLLEDSDIEKIRKYMRENPEERTRNQYIRFEKDSRTGLKKFAGIASFAGNSNMTGSLAKKKTQQNRSHVEWNRRDEIGNRRLVGRVQDAFERGSVTKSDDVEAVEDDNVIDEKIRGLLDQGEAPKEEDRSGIRSGSGMVISTPQMRTSTKSRYDAPSDRFFGKSEESGETPKINYRNYEQKLNSFRFTTEKKREEGGRAIGTEERSAPSNNERSTRMSKTPSVQESVKESKKRKHEEIGVRNEGHVYDLKKVKTNEYYEQRSLIISDAWKSRRKVDLDVSYQGEVIVCVDLEEGYRQFVKDEEQEEESESQNDMWQRLTMLAQKYRVPSDKINVLFNQVSYDFEDLETYLRTGNAIILWTADEDKDLLEGDETAMRYLKKIKGEEKMKQRRKYLIGE